MHTYTHTYTHSYACTHICLYTSAYITYKQNHEYTDICLYTYICVHAFLHTCTHAWIYLHTYIIPHVHTYAYTFKQAHILTYMHAHERTDAFMVFRCPFNFLSWKLNTQSHMLMALRSRTCGKPHALKWLISHVLMHDGRGCYEEKAFWNIWSLINMIPSA